MTRAQRISIHQAAHGYSDGHRELWSSLQLTPRDTKLVLAYSDTSGSGLRIGDRGYLTGYPLAESGYYALARTWPAPEVQRPGAVWTHTLFVEFSDVADIQDAAALLTLFRKPLSDAASLEARIQREPIEFWAIETESFTFSTNSNEEWYRQIVACLYGCPDSRVVGVYPPSDAKHVERCVLALWSQQWPRLRRSFRFCTLTSSDRSSEKVSFDLQLVPESERGIRRKFSSAAFARDATVISESWVNHLVDDLTQPSATGLREFLQQAGADVSAGRRAFVPLTRLHLFVTAGARDRDRWDEAVALVEDLSKGAAIKILHIVLGLAATEPHLLSPAGLEFILKNLGVLTPESLMKCSGQLGRAIWATSPERVAALHNLSQAGRLIAEAALETLSQDDLVVGLQSALSLAETAFSRRPDLFASEAIWQSGSLLVESALKAAAQEPELSRIALQKMIGGSCPSVVASAFSVFGGETVWQELAFALRASAEPRGQLEPWVAAGAHYPGALAQILASGVVSDRRSLSAIAQATDPDLVPNEYGVDPWAIASEVPRGDASFQEEVFLCCYLLARALGPRSKSIVSLVERSLGTVYDAAAGESMTTAAWAVLEPRLPKVGYWQQWDRCEQLLAAVAQLYVRRDLSASSFCQLGRTESEFSSLVEAAAREWGGRSYLRSVKRELKRWRTGNLNRMGVIERAVDSWF